MWQSTVDGLRFHSVFTSPETAILTNRQPWQRLLPDCSGITEISIPASVTYIGNQEEFWAGPVFSGCSSLKAINVDEANEGYASLDGILYTKDMAKIVAVPGGLEAEGFTVPAGVTEILPAAFQSCSGLTGELTIPEGVSVIGFWAFSGCSGFSGRLAMPESLKEIGAGAFSECSGFSGPLVIPGGVEEIGAYAFTGCSGLTGSIAIPRSITHIPEALFMDCSGFSGRVEIAEGVVEIGTEAFAGTGITSVSIPASVTQIGGDSYDGKSYQSFPGCTSLTSIEVDEGNVMYSSAGGALFNKDMTLLITVPAGTKSTRYVIPGSVTGVQAWAFDSCEGLTGSVVIPDGVIGHLYWAFDGCTGLKAFEVSAGNGHFSSPGGILYNKAQTELINIPNRLEMAEYVMPDSVAEIGPDAFKLCGSLEKIVLSSAGMDLWGYSFSGATSLKAFEVPEQNLRYSSVGGALFNKEKTELVAVPSGLERYAVPEGVETVGAGAFSYSDNLATAVLPSSVTEIGGAAFSHCGSLENITLPENLKTIGGWAFDGCPRLKEAVFKGDAPEIVYGNYGTDKPFDDAAEDFKILYDPAKEGWSTPLWYGYPAEPLY
ncbi:MAG: leucine-rich repeat domain-containing protein [Clostridiales bacterium]|nr:leucine-rich repeat domain-containing protein [Clostridiales bacterium]